MASSNEFQDLDDEVLELLKNYKHKKATAYEPCSLKNINECLIGLREELDLFNISYTFNPHVDIDDNVLTPEALVKLINSVWTLLYYHKSVKEKADALTEQNHVLEHQNKQLHGSLGKFKDKLSIEKNGAKACVAEAQKVSDRSDELLHALTETRAKLLKVNKQKDAIEKSLRNEISRIKLENNKLTDRLRNKSSVHVSCSEVCDSTMLRLKERERKHLAVISQLQLNNQELLREVLALKEEIIMGGLQNYDIDDKTK
ncbi:uncharacterized protein LOC114363529 [Ostrinia furnacalis]|uniref:uncharacterized protein LOC114363529 n=1 Tax=Ostrinia furnacalis TaxID=93504 RepID=UPI0010392398|nr:uncharacterized protein LOC114363529 [Ostrinia furnacalis]